MVPWYVNTRILETMVSVNVFVPFAAPSTAEVHDRLPKRRKREHPHKSSYELTPTLGVCCSLEGAPMISLPASWSRICILIDIVTSVSNVPYLSATRVYLTVRASNIASILVPCSCSSNFRMYLNMRLVIVSDEVGCRFTQV